MSQKLFKIVALVLLGVLLATLPGLAGCAKEKGEVSEVAVGFLTDFTGVACYAVKQLYDGTTDYFSVVEEENLIPGVRIRCITADTRTEYARLVPGYLWLKGQGAVLMSVGAATDQEILADRFEEDGIPCFGWQASTKLQGHKWLFTLHSSPQSQPEAILQWIMDTWDYEGMGRKPRIGHIGATYGTTDHYQGGIDAFLRANPEELDWVGVEKAPMGTSAWAVEISRLEDCDFIIVSLVGPMVASFVREARGRWYDGSLVSGIEGFPGYWDLVTAAVSPEDLYGCFFAFFEPWWTEDVPYINELKEYTLTHYSPAEAEVRMRQSGYLTGWAVGMVMADVIRRAVEEAGAGNVDRTAIRDALAEIDTTVEGFGNPWRFAQNQNFLCRAQRVFEWSATEKEWFAASDWITPPLLAGG